MEANHKEANHKEANHKEANHKEANHKHDHISVYGLNLQLVAGYGAATDMDSDASGLSSRVKGQPYTSNLVPCQGALRCAGGADMEASVSVHYPS
ncbi:hypothetical protein GGTG_11936 [Gaeumannomyces tritici R3-111a-1]|uniref:Uncharacterized protein n=1 Tax=Gaeumannomyces tritici (strain R3-111a-1) TaxID=644352 RepID=J3PEK5_GAET3|nr:hypothetical protein GGTG_11936 [Gaeumannomyces tritici R3-111a-1]EJT70913.1 hypothetical protein GGTG_11936 [Gaeumannomyces tritici R3-111a-1]